MDLFPSASLVERRVIYSLIHELSFIIFSNQKKLARLLLSNNHFKSKKANACPEVAQARRLLIEITFVLKELIASGSLLSVDLDQALSYKYAGVFVGTVIDAKGNEHKLSFAEACNKLVEAKKALFEVQSVAEKMGGLDGRIKLQGSLGQSSWTAYIQLSDFIRMAVLQL